MSLLMGTAMAGNVLGLRTGLKADSLLTPSSFLQITSIHRAAQLVAGWVGGPRQAVAAGTRLLAEVGALWSFCLNPCLPI